MLLSVLENARLTPVPGELRKTATRKADDPLAWTGEVRIPPPTPDIIAGIPWPANGTGPFVCAFFLRQGEIYQASDHPRISACLSDELVGLHNDGVRAGLRERQSELMCTRDLSPSSKLGGVVLLGSAKIHILLIPRR